MAHVNNVAWFRSRAWTVILLIVISPLGLYLMWRYQGWPTWLKSVVSVLVAFVALMVVAGVVGGGGDDDDEPSVVVDGTLTAGVELTPDASTPAPAGAEPTETPEPERYLTITAPEPGSRICKLEPSIIVTGLAAPGSLIRGEDRKAIADQEGQWKVAVKVDEGENTLTFELDEDGDVEAEVKVEYCLPPNADRARGLLVVLNEIRDPLAGADFFCEPEFGNRLVAVNVTVINESDETKSIRAFDFEVRDSNAVQWEPDLFQCVSPTMESIDIGAGGELSGWVTFQVRADSELTEVYYDPQILNTDDIHIAIR